MESVLLRVSLSNIRVLLLIISLVCCVRLYFFRKKERPNNIDISLRRLAPPCGDICKYTVQDQINNVSSKFYPQLSKKINCKNILHRMMWKPKDNVYPPLKYPPTELITAFTQYGRVPFKERWYFNEAIPKTFRVWSEKMVRDMQRAHKSGVKISSYNTGGLLTKLAKTYSSQIEGKKGIVIGTIRPWLEATLLNAGAGNITTSEYSKLIIKHPQIKVIHPFKLAKTFLDGQAESFDFGASFSSLEHSGLGRYGDPINPYGDLEAMAQVWCMMKPGGIFFLGLPISRTGESFMQWNAWRVYAKERLQHVTANWEVLKMEHCPDVHGILVLKKVNSMNGM